MTENKKINIEIPGPDAPGYLRRVMLANKYATMQKEGNLTPDAYEALVEFLLDFIVSPKDRVEARDALLDASSNQFADILNAVIGKDQNPT